MREAIDIGCVEGGWAGQQPGPGPAAAAEVSQVPGVLAGRHLGGSRGTERGRGQGAVYLAGVLVWLFPSLSQGRRREVDG